MQDIARFLEEFDHEISGVREALSRLDPERLDFKPHPKSPTMGWLAGHLAYLPHWATVTLTANSFDIATGERPEPPSSKPAILGVFETKTAEARTALLAATRESLAEPWSLLHAGNPVFTLPRATVLRRFFFNHIIHHRAQLGLYLRLNDIPVPSHYGPSADEQPPGR